MFTANELKRASVFLGLNLWQGTGKMKIDIQSMQDILAKMKAQGKNGIIISVNEFEKLFTDIQSLQKEADWLADQCQTLSGYSPVLRQGQSKNQWREEARKAAQNG